MPPFTPATSIYLVLDMQNDLVSANGPNGKSALWEQVQGRDVVQRTADAIAQARAAGVRIGFVRVAFSPDYRECPASSPVFGAARGAGLFRLGAWGAEIHDALKPLPGDISVIKHRVSPFFSTTLSAQLSALNVGRIYCSGVSTQAVVQATVRDAHDRDFEVVVLEDCCAAHSAQEHQNSIGSIGRFCTVVQSSDVTFS